MNRAVALLLGKLSLTRGFARRQWQLSEVLASADFPYSEISLRAELHLPEAKRGTIDPVWDSWCENEIALRRKARELPG